MWSTLSRALGVEAGGGGGVEPAGSCVGPGGGRQVTWGWDEDLGDSGPRRGQVAGGRDTDFKDPGDRPSPLGERQGQVGGSEPCAPGNVLGPCHRPAHNRLFGI